MSTLQVYRICESNAFLAGTIDMDTRTFAYAEDYLGQADAAPLSISLPLVQKPYSEEAFKPYFDGLLPEGDARRSLAAELAVRTDDYLAVLASSSFDCIGDVAIGQGEFAGFPDASYEPLTSAKVREILSDDDAIARTDLASRLSLAGTQHKLGLAHMPGANPDDGWMQPLHGAASSHILKTGQIARIPELEYLCMTAARRCGLTAPSIHLMQVTPLQTAVCVERFDREIFVATPAGQEADDICGAPETHVPRDGAHGQCMLHVERMHQEDMAQALGIGPESKYRELEQGTITTIASLLRGHSLTPLADIVFLARIICFDYLVGNCDNHLKNLSVMYPGKGDRITLAPAYDIVPTTSFPQFSRDMGMKIGDVRDIDAVTPDSFEALARDLQMKLKSLRAICARMIDDIVPAIMGAGEKIAESFAVLPYLAEDLVDDMAPRIQVVKRFIG